MTVVYFAQMGRDGAIKIGFAKDLKQRMHGIQTPEPMVVLATLPGARPLEARLHRALRKHHKRNEWFEPSAEVRAVVAIAKHRGIAAVERWLDAQDAADRVPVAPMASDDLDRDIKELTRFALREVIAQHGLAAAASASGLKETTLEGYRRKPTDIGFTAILGLAKLSPESFRPLFARIGFALVEAGEAIDSYREKAA